jgi:hypothetical protein
MWVGGLFCARGSVRVRLRCLNPHQRVMGAPPLTAAGTAMHVGATPAMSAAPAGTQSVMPPMMPIANMRTRGCGRTVTIRASFDRDPLYAGRRIAAALRPSGGAEPNVN